MKTRSGRKQTCLPFHSRFTEGAISPECAVHHLQITFFSNGEPAGSELCRRAIITWLFIPNGITRVQLLADGIMRGFIHFMTRDQGRAGKP